MMRRLTICAIPVFMAGIALCAAASACDGKGVGDVGGVDDQSKRGVGEVGAVYDQSKTGNGALLATQKTDSARLALLREDSIRALEADSTTRYRSLTDADFQLVADEIQVEVAAMKAVVLVEAGSEMKGFWAPGIPVVNFDPSVYKSVASKAPNKAGNKNAKVPAGLSGYALKEWTQLTKARHINAQGADMGTFWGMFQIGGFNYKLCGCKSVEEFVEKMSFSELSQLELFAHFLEGAGMVKYLRNKDWARFARAYNGTSYAKRGYHTKMANAYKKFSKK